MLSIVKFPNPILRQKINDWSFEDANSIEQAQQLEKDMI